MQEGKHVRKCENKLANGNNDCKNKARKQTS